jgi:translation elongation factor EF-1alpha
MLEFKASESPLRMPIFDIYKTQLLRHTVVIGKIMQGYLNVSTTTLHISHINAALPIKWIKHLS